MFIVAVFRFRYGVVDCCGLRLIVLVFAFYWCGLDVIMVCYLVARVYVVFVWLVGCGFFLNFEVVCLVLLRYCLAEFVGC